MTFFEVYDKWLEEHKAEVKETSFANYLFRRKVFSYYIAEDTDICTLDEERMKAFFERFHNEGKSRRYMDDMLMVFRMVMRFAEKSGVANLPSIDWKLKDISSVRIGSKTKPHAKRYTVEDYERIVEVFKTNPTPAGLAVIVTMFTGLRIGEACGLKFSDIDIDKSVMHIQRTCVPIDKGVQKMYHPDEDIQKSCRLQTPKSVTSDRFIPIIPPLRRLLRGYTNVYPGKYFVSTFKAQPSHVRMLRCQFIQMCKEAGVAYIGYHSLRHTFATQMIEKGVDIKTVSSILGHSGVEITMDVYCHPSDDTKRAGIQKAFRPLLK